MNITLEFGKRLTALIERLCGISKQPNITFSGGGIVYIVKADNPDVRFTINPGEARDSEGNVVETPSLEWDVSSDDPQVVSIEVDDDNDPKTGGVHFGSPGTANLNITGSKGGNILVSFGAQFTVTAGDVSTVSGGSIAFDGLAEASSETSGDTGEAGTSSEDGNSLNG